MTFWIPNIKSYARNFVYYERMAKTYQSIPDKGYFNMIGLPAELALLIGLLEVIRGLFLIPRSLTRIVALLFALELISALIIVNTSNVVILPEGYELALLSIPVRFLAISVSLMLTGLGRF